MSGLDRRLEWVPSDLLELDRLPERDRGATDPVGIWSTGRSVVLDVVVVETARGATILTGTEVTTLAGAAEMVSGAVVSEFKTLGTT